MEKKWRNYFTGKLRHINIRFFVNDRVDKGEVKIDYFPTQIMLEEYFTKPLKGEVFKIFREVIMGYKSILSLQSNQVSIKEHVGNNGGKCLKLFLIKNVTWHVCIKKYNLKTNKLKESQKYESNTNKQK